MKSAQSEPSNRNSNAAAGVFCYLGGILFPIIFFTMEPYKSTRFIRFHAFQSILFWAVGFVLYVASENALLPRKVNEVLFTAFVFVWVALMLLAYRGKMSKLPLIGTLAERIAG